MDSPNFKIDCSLAYSCASLWFYLFGIFILSVEATSTFTFFILFSGPLLTYYTILKFSIPQPNEAIATEILGRELIPESEQEYLQEDAEVSKDDGSRIIMSVIAHRFAGLDAPENTLEALELCHKNGAIGVEFDLVLSKDLVPIVFHDTHVDRVTNSSGDIQSKTWAELQKLDVSVKHPFHEKFKGSKIPHFEDVIKKLIEYDLRLFIDIKDDRPEIINIILETYKKYPVLYRRAIVSSFNFWIIYGIRRRDPNIVASMAWRPYHMSFCKYSAREEECIPYSNSPIIYYYYRLMDHLTTWFYNNLACHLVGFSVALLNKDVITPGVVSFWRSRNVRVVAWTVNRPLEKLHLVRNLGVPYMTDSMLGN